MRSKAVLTCCGTLLLISGATAMAGVRVAHLRTEYLTHPLGIDAVQPRLSWVLESDEREVRQAAYQILVAGAKDELGGDKGGLWDSGKVLSGDTAQIVYAGATLKSGQQVFWKVRVWTDGDLPSSWSEAGSWRMGPLEPAAWQAQWISAPGVLQGGDPPPALPSPMFRKVFSLSKPMKQALVTVSSLGLYELRINGQRVGDALLTPEWTDFKKRVQYQTYDVTALLTGGRNVVGAMLGDGWYAGRIGISHVDPAGPLRNFYGRRLHLAAQIVIEYQDGSSETVITDGAWKATTEGPIIKACILDGEVYDARKEMPGWDKDGYDDSGWKPVEVQDRIGARLVAQPNEPVRVTEELEPVKITESQPGRWVVDFGQVLAGFCRAEFNAPAGTTITLRHAEVLNQDGSVYRDNLRMAVYEGDKNLKWGKYLGARQEDQYTSRGGAGVFEPRFTYHGFRYVEITGLPSKEALVSIKARVFHSAPPVSGRFECSSPLLNKLMSNITWTLRDNLPSVPTDCPQRDERLGWMGDMLVFAQPACYLMDMAGFFTKWSADIRDAQAKDGRYPDFAPHPFDPDARFSGVPAWGDCGVVVPWRMYVNYGDKRILAEHFDSARRWVDWIHSNNPDLLWKSKRHNDYGDWLNGDTLDLAKFGFPKGGSEVPKETFATAFFQQSAAIVAKMATVIGKTEEAARYAKLAEDIRTAFIKAYVKEDGRIAGNTQSSYALALNLGLLPEDKRAAAVGYMIERVKAYKDHISTGFHTSIMLMNELTRAGRNDVAYMLINNRTIPSWGYTIEQGATTIWERWDGYVEGRGFQNAGMNSFCHYAIGSVGEWMYRTILGIHPDESHPGYRHFELRPVPGGGLAWAKGSYDSISGRIASEWKLDGGTLTLKVTVPANTTASLYLPAAVESGVTESGEPVGRARGIKAVRMENGVLACELGSGTYTFVSTGVGQ
ncbi:MAG: glycoside hydrolase family 78 protein [Phycisphaerae bacterium]|nr:glycoside hydrolase family 78 protein [Phycisphaerae bacterium]